MIACTSIAVGMSCAAFGHRTSSPSITISTGRSDVLARCNVAWPLTFGWRMSEATVHSWTASDGVQLAYHEVGQGRPVVLLHGLFSDAHLNWIKFGHADRIASE